LAEDQPSLIKQGWRLSRTRFSDVLHRKACITIDESGLFLNGVANRPFNSNRRASTPLTTGYYNPSHIDISGLFCHDDQGSYQLPQALIIYFLTHIEHG
jgi:hypothetical protein